MAWCTPSRSAPGTGSPRATVAPPASTIASKSARSCGGGDVAARRHPAAELGALGQHLHQPPVQVALLHLELGDPVAQQPAGRVGPLEHGHRVPGPGQLLGRGQPGRPGADDRHPPARPPPPPARAAAAAPSPRPRPGR